MLTAQIITLYPLIVICAGLVPTLGPELPRLLSGICTGIHSMEPVVGGDELSGRVSQSRRVADHDTFLVADYEALTVDTATASAIQVMRPDV